MSTRSQSTQLVNSLNPLGYMGVNPSTPPAFLQENRPPTSDDSQGYFIGTLWLDQSVNPPAIANVWMLTALNGYQATWVNFGAGDLETLTGNSGGAVGPTAGNINVIGDGLTINIVGNPGTSTLTASVVTGTGVLQTLTGDTGGPISPTAGNINIFGAHGINTSGAASTITTAINNAITLGDLAPLAANTGALTATTGDVIITAGDLTLPNTNTAGNQGIIKIGGNRFVHNYGSSIGVSGNVFVGENAGNTTMDAACLSNTGVGYQALQSMTVASVSNTAVGTIALKACTTGDSNTAIGNHALPLLTTGQFNEAVGSQAMDLLTTGSSNTAVGTQSLQNLLTGSSNIAIGFIAGQAYSSDETNNIIIGRAATGVVGEKGTTRIATYSVDASTTNNTFVGYNSGNNTYTLASAVSNVGLGSYSLESLTTGAGNIGIGNNGLSDVTTGDHNVGINGGEGITTGTNNTAVGYQSLDALTTGSENTCIGQSSGALLTLADSANVCINAQGAAGNNNTIRIADSTGGANEATRCFIGGIRGITTGNNNAVAVLIDSAGQLGTTSSSIKFKENIRDMQCSSEPLFQLRPVCFNFKDDVNLNRQFGLIAEEVKEVMPELVAHDEHGNPYSVKYHDLPVLLLNELQRLAHRVKELEDRL